MNINEIKKLLYKQRPPADLVEVSKDGITYVALFHQTETSHVVFRVPLSELSGDVKWLPEMESQLLIKYIVNEETSG